MALVLGSIRRNTALVQSIYFSQKVSKFVPFNKQVVFALIFVNNCTLHRFNSLSNIKSIASETMLLSILIKRKKKRN